MVRCRVQAEAVVALGIVVASALFDR